MSSDSDDEPQLGQLSDEELQRRFAAGESNLSVSILQPPPPPKKKRGYGA